MILMASYTTTFSSNCIILTLLLFTMLIRSDKVVIFANFTEKLQENKLLNGSEAEE